MLDQWVCSRALLPCPSPFRVQRSAATIARSDAKVALIPKPAKEERPQTVARPKTTVSGGRTEGVGRPQTIAGRARGELGRPGTQAGRGSSFAGILKQSEAVRALIKERKAASRRRTRTASLPPLKARTPREGQAAGEGAADGEGAGGAQASPRGGRLDELMPVSPRDAALREAAKELIKSPPPAVMGSSVQATQETVWTYMEEELTTLETENETMNGQIDLLASQTEALRQGEIHPQSVVSQLDSYASALETTNQRLGDEVAARGAQLSETNQRLDSLVKEKKELKAELLKEKQHVEQARRERDAVKAGARALNAKIEEMEEMQEKEKLTGLELPPAEAEAVEGALQDILGDVEDENAPGEGDDAEKFVGGADESHKGLMAEAEAEDRLAAGREAALGSLMAGVDSNEVLTSAADAETRVEKAYAAGRDALARSEAAGEDAAAGLAAEAATIAAVRDGATQEAADAAAEAAKAVLAAAAAVTGVPREEAASTLSRLAAARMAEQAAEELAFAMGAVEVTAENAQAAAEAAAKAKAEAEARFAARFAAAEVAAKAEEELAAARAAAAEAAAAAETAKALEEESAAAEAAQAADPRAVEEAAAARKIAEEAAAAVFLAEENVASANTIASEADTSADEASARETAAKNALMRAKEAAMSARLTEQAAARAAAEAPVVPVGGSDGLGSADVLAALADTAAAAAVEVFDDVGADGASVAAKAAAEVVQSGGAREWALAAAEAVSRVISRPSEPRIGPMARWAALQAAGGRRWDLIIEDLSAMIEASLEEVVQQAEIEEARADAAELGVAPDPDEEPRSHLSAAELKKQQRAADEAVSAASVDARRSCNGSIEAIDAAKAASEAALQTNPAKPAAALAAGQAAARATAAALAKGAPPAKAAEAAKLAAKVALQACADAEKAAASEGVKIESEAVNRASREAAVAAAECVARGRPKFEAQQAGRAVAAAMLLLPNEKPGSKKLHGAKAAAKSSAAKAAAKHGNPKVALAASAAAVSAFLSGKPAVAIEAAGDAAAKAVAASAKELQAAQRSTGKSKWKASAKLMSMSSTLRSFGISIKPEALEEGGDVAVEAADGEAERGGRRPSTENAMMSAIAATKSVDRMRELKERDARAMARRRKREMDLALSAVGLAAGAKAAKAAVGLVNASNKAAKAAGGTPEEIAKRGLKAAKAARMCASLGASPAAAAAMTIGNSVQEATSALSAVIASSKVVAKSGKDDSKGLPGDAAGRDADAVDDIMGELFDGDELDALVAAAIVAADSARAGGSISQATRNGSTAATAVFSGMSLEEARARGSATAPAIPGWTLEAWLGGLSFDKVVSDAVMKRVREKLPQGVPTQAYEQAFVTKLGERGSVDTIVALLKETPVLQQLAEAICAGAVELKTELDEAKAAQEEAAAEAAAEAARPKTAAELNAEAQANGGFTLSYSTDASLYWDGLTRLIGPPRDPMVFPILASMEHDHMHNIDADVSFTVGNYGTTTTSRVEWLFVTDPVFGIDTLREQKIKLGPSYLSAWPGTVAFFEEAKRAAGSANSEDAGHRHTRDAKSWNDFAPAREKLNQQLMAINEQPISEPEFFALRLYTGPLYVVMPLASASCCSVYLDP